MLKKMNKHFVQIKRGGVKVIAKKLRSLIYLLLQTPVYLLSIPLIVILRLIKSWYLIRWGELISSRIGHFIINTELYCCKRDAGINSPSQKYLDLFYLRKYVCNKQIEKMWGRSLIVLPAWLLGPLSTVNRFFCLFISGFKEHEIVIAIDDTNIHNLIDRFSAHINFTPKEEFEGEEILKKFGLAKDAKFVCLHVRDPGYLNRHAKHEYMGERWHYHSFRDGDIDRYVLAAEELANRGYYVFRMGINVLKPLKSSNPKVIDYAKSGMRNDFMDIYLSAKCNFFISPGSGLDGVSVIFHRPVAYIGHLPFGNFAHKWNNNKKTLVLTKHHINKRNQKELTISEIFSANVAFAYTSDEYKLNDVELKENSPEEIRDFVIEMDERLNGHWKETKEDLLLQKRFWSIFEDRIKRLNLKSMPRKMKIRFGAKFLRENQNWIR
tara:strand:- start:183 stop:1493 length:1311 start_codon:yes stop_codon:yes gene_type:complete